MPYKGENMIITVGAEKGGVAKTRLATHIATLAAKSGADVVLGPDALEALVAVARQAALGRAAAVAALAQNYRTMLECALLSDLVLVPCGADQQEIESTLNVFDALRQVGPRHPKGEVPAAVVLTRVSTLAKAKATADIRDYFASENVDVFTAHIASRSSWLVTGRSGLIVSELTGKERSEKAVEEMQAVFDEIIQRIHGGSMNKGTSVFKRRALPAEQVAAAQEAASGSPLTGDPRLPAAALTQSPTAAAAPMQGENSPYAVGNVYEVPLELIRSNPLNPRVVYTSQPPRISMLAK